jgi:hypothetical protein
MVSAAYKARYYYPGGSTGFPQLLDMSVEPGSSLLYGIQANGLTGAVSHVSGFGIDLPEDPFWGSPYAVTLQYHTATREAKHLVGMDVARLYTNASNARGSGYEDTWLLEHDLSGAGIRYSSFALWTYYGPFIDGYKAGNPLYWGAFTFGSPTVSSEVSAMASRSYSGLAGGVVSYGAAESVNPYYGAVNASYDAASQSVTVTLQLTEQHNLYYVFPLGLPPSLQESDATGAPGGPVAAATISCQAPVVNGTFSCGDATGAGAIAGQLYGPNGDEVAGTFSHYSFMSPGFDGVIGGFAAKASSSGTLAVKAPSRRAVR